MLIGRRRHVLENAMKALGAAQRNLERSIEWAKVDAALARHALKQGGGKELDAPDDDLRLCLAEQFAHLQIARENLMNALGRKHLLSIRPFYAPLDPDDSEEFVAKIWTLLWPDRRYPRFEQLTPEQRYFAFGPGGHSKADPPK